MIAPIRGLKPTAKFIRPLRGGEKAVGRFPNWLMHLPYLTAGPTLHDANPVHPIEIRYITRATTDRDFRARTHHHSNADSPRRLDQSLPSVRARGLRADRDTSGRPSIPVAEEFRAIRRRSRRIDSARR